MLATVLKSELAVQQSVVIMRAFKNMRHYIIENRQLASKEDLQRIALSVGEYQKKTGVQVILFTENGFGRSRDFLTSSEVTDFNREYPTIQIKPNPDCHDRFIVLDYGTKSEKVFHCGASNKDAGKKVCAINAIENTVMVHPIFDALLLNPDKVI